MRDASAPKLTLAPEIFLVHEFEVLLVFSSYVTIQNFDWMFFVTDLMNENTSYFLKIWSNKNVWNFAI